MGIERVILLRTLKAGKSLWLEGTVLERPLPPDILKEVELGTGTVKVLHSTPNLPKVRRTEARVVSAPDFKDSVGNIPSSTSTTVEAKTVVVENKPKAKKKPGLVIRRKK